MDNPETVDVILPELTPRQQAFVNEYLIDLNGTQAAIRAGYSPTSANEIASQNLAKLNIAAAVERGKAQRQSRVGMTADTVLHEMSLLATARLEHYVVDDDGQVRPADGAPEGVMAAIQSIKRKCRIHYDKEGNVTGKDYDVEIRLWDKPGSLKLMGRHVGLFPNKVELSGPNGGPIPVSEVRRTVVDPKGTLLTDGEPVSSGLGEGK